MYILSGRLLRSAALEKTKTKSVYNGMPSQTLFVFMLARSTCILSFLGYMWAARGLIYLLNRMGEFENIG